MCLPAELGEYGSVSPQSSKGGATQEQSNDQTCCEEASQLKIDVPDVLHYLEVTDVYN